MNHDWLVVNQLSIIINQLLVIGRYGYERLYLAMLGRKQEKQLVSSESHWQKPSLHQVIWWFLGDS